MFPLKIVNKILSTTRYLIIWYLFENLQKKKRKVLYLIHNHFKQLQSKQIRLLLGFPGNIC